jgi:uncharacterized protein (DUF58 family)
VNARQRGVSSLFVTSVMLCFVGLCLLVALINSARPLTILCLLVFGIMAGLKFWTGIAAPSLECEFDIDKTKVFRGESVKVTLHTTNRRLLPLSFETHIPFGDGLRPASGNGPIEAENTLLWFQSLRHKWDLLTTSRGIQTVGPVAIAAGDILGFFVTEREVKERFEVIVYPRLVPLRPFPLPKREFFGTPGVESPVDDPVYVLGTIDYHHSRPARHIHWKASARHNRLQQKVFEPTEQEKALLVADVGGFAEQRHEDAFEKTLEVVASLAARFDRQGCAVGLMTNGVVTKGAALVPVTRNPHQMGSILEALARVQMRREMSLPDLLRRSFPIPWGTTCIYFALESTGETDRTRALFSHRRMPVVFLTYEDCLDLREERHKRPTENRPQKAAMGGATFP